MSLTMFPGFTRIKLVPWVAIAAVSMMTSCVASHSQKLNLSLKGWDTTSPECAFPEPTRDMGQGFIDKFINIPYGASLSKITKVMGNPDDLQTLAKVKTLSWTNENNNPTIVLVGYFNKDNTLAGKEIILNNYKYNKLHPKNCSWRVIDESN